MVGAVEGIKAEGVILVVSLLMAWLLVIELLIVLPFLPFFASYFFFQFLDAFFESLQLRSNLLSICDVRFILVSPLLLLLDLLDPFLSILHLFFGIILDPLDLAADHVVDVLCKFLELLLNLNVLLLGLLSLLMELGELQSYFFHFFLEVVNGFEVVFELSEVIKEVIVCFGVDEVPEICVSQ